MSQGLIGTLKEWQTGIGALLGFIALMVAALWNAHLNRRRDERIRADEAKSVAAALYSEIVLLRKEAATLASIVAALDVHRGTGRSGSMKFDEHFFAAHTLSESTLYEGLSAKVGMLSAEIVIAITEFYAKFEEVRKSLPLLADNDERPYSYNVTVVLRPARDAVKNVVPALRRIEALVSVSQPADADLEMGYTDDLIELEDLRSSEIQ